MSDNRKPVLVLITSEIGAVIDCRIQLVDDQHPPTLPDGSQLRHGMTAYECADFKTWRSRTETKRVTP